jgi:hypothetical protein
MAALAPDRNLLFGLLALQNGLIDQGQLVAAFQAWTLDKACAIADHLIGRGDLDADGRNAVDVLVALHLKKYGGDAEKSLAAIPTDRSTRAKLAGLGDPQIITLFHADDALRGDPGRSSLGLLKLLRRFLAVFDAIDDAHSRSILHRDLKPSNVVLGKHGETLAVDWGLAKALGRAESDVASDECVLVPSLSSGSAETLPGSALGTQAYMSPEQTQGDLEHVGPRSDVYGLGATLSCMLRGRPPVEDDEVGAVRCSVPCGRVIFRSRGGSTRRSILRWRRSATKRWPHTPRTGTPRRGPSSRTSNTGWPTSRSSPGASPGRGVCGDGSDATARR